MDQRLRGAVRRILPPPVRRLIRAVWGVDFAKKSYSQEGEDRILFSLFDLNNNRERKGFYVDIGAHHPERISNTHLLYRRGWTGINVDPFPGGMKLFKKKRPRDTNLEVGISARRQMLKYYIFNEPVFNGFSEDVAKKADGFRGVKLLSSLEIETMPLSELLDKHLPAGRPIDFLNIDVEGLDLEVLQSNDWARYRPAVVAVEDGEFMSLADGNATEIMKFMGGVGYAPYCKTPLTTFYAQTSEVKRGPAGVMLQNYG
jgi:FkbM family methyltransferase